MICHQRTSTAGVLFSIWRTFFHRERERDHSEHAMPYHAIPINKYAKQKQQVHQSKQQICHLNQKNTPTKTPSTPSQPKEYANQNTKYAISIKRVRQPKHQVRHLNQKNTPTKTPKTPPRSESFRGAGSCLIIISLFTDGLQVELCNDGQQGRLNSDQEAQGGGASIPLFLLIKC